MRMLISTEDGMWKFFYRPSLMLRRMLVFVAVFWVVFAAVMLRGGGQAVPGIIMTIFVMFTLIMVVAVAAVCLFRVTVLLDVNTGRLREERTSLFGSSSTEFCIPHAARALHTPAAEGEPEQLWLVFEDGTVHLGAVYRVGAEEAAALLPLAEKFGLEVTEVSG